MVDAQLIFEDLISRVSTRQAKSLTILNQVLKVQSETEGRNFTIAEISRISVGRGGPSAQTIRNKTGLVFRQLIDAWATQAGTTWKGSSPILKGHQPPKDHELLQRLSDPALRAIFGQIIAERNRFRNELNILKSHSELIVDRRPIQNSVSAENSVQILPAVQLNDMEISALKAAISGDFFEIRDWTVSKAGQVRDENKREIYKHGYTHAIKKILNEV